MPDLTSVLAGLGGIAVGSVATYLADRRRDRRQDRDAALERYGALRLILMDLNRADGILKGLSTREFTGPLLLPRGAWMEHRKLVTSHLAAAEFEAVGQAFNGIVNWNDIVDKGQVDAPTLATDRAAATHRLRDLYPRLQLDIKRAIVACCAARDRIATIHHQP